MVVVYRYPLESSVLLLAAVRVCPVLLVLRHRRFPGHMPAHLTRHEQLRLVILSRLVHSDAAGRRVALPRGHHNHSSLLVSALKLLDLSILGRALYIRSSVAALRIQRLPIATLVREVIKGRRICNQRVPRRVVAKVGLIH